MILAFLIMSLVIWTLSVIMNLYTVASQSRGSGITFVTVLSLIVNLVMVTFNIIAIASL
jgi:hypothetical protein